MIARFVLALLLACLALPAMAAPSCAPVTDAPAAPHACADAAMTRHTAPSHADAQPDRHQHPIPHPAVPHDCIGCIAPIARIAYRPADPIVHAVAAPRPARADAALPHRSGAPEPPPPRLPA